MDSDSTTYSMNTTGNSTNATEYYYYYYYELVPNEELWFKVALGLQWMNTILIITLNTVVIVSILRYEKKSRLYFLLLHMAIADLMTGVIDSLFNAIERTLGLPYVSQYWFAGDAFCRIQRTLGSVSLCASNFILAATSTDRAFVVVKPMLSIKRGNTLQKILVASCWIAAAALSSPILNIMSQVMVSPANMYRNYTIPECKTMLNIEEWKILYYLMFVFYFLLPITVVITSYTTLICAIYKRARSPPNSVRGTDNLRLSVVFNKALPTSKIRSIKLTFGIIVSFIVAWTPYFVMLYLNIFKGYRDPNIMPFITTYYWSCSVNPIIFFVFHKRGTFRSPLSSGVSTSNTLSSKARDSTLSLRLQSFNQLLY